VIEKYLTKKEVEEKRDKYIIFECNKEGCAGWADRLKGFLIIKYYLI